MTSINSLIGKLFILKIWTIFLVTSVLFFGSLLYLLYPKTEITMLISASNFDKEGNLNLSEYSELFKLKEILSNNGIKLEYKFQPESIAADMLDEIPVAEYFIKNPTKYDASIINNYGANLPSTSLNQFRSLGVIDRKPILFLKKTNHDQIKLFKDLLGKNIIFASAPEGKKNPTFTKDANRASIFSEDYLLEKIFVFSGVRNHNSNLINTWPNLVEANLEWDVYISFGNMPLQGVDSSIVEAYLDGKVDFINFEDIQSLPFRLNYIELVELPKSSYLPWDNKPKENIYIPTYTSSFIVNKDLDSSLVLILSEALKKIHSPQGLLNKKNEFPYFSNVEYFAPHPVSQKFYIEGDQSILSKYLPPTFAAFIAKLLFIFGPILLLSYPIFLFTPKILKLSAQLKIAEWYRKIYAIEKSIMNSQNLSPEIFLKELKNLDIEINEYRFRFINNQFVQELYIVREHIEMIRNKLNQ
jgi:hypothetical protein